MPFSAFAQTSTNKEQVGFCQKLPDDMSALREKLRLREERISQMLAEKRTQVAERIASRDAQLADGRVAWDQVGKQQYIKLEERATTSEQIAAVKQFESDIDTAIATRRKAIDLAFSVYNSALKDESEKRVSRIELAMKTYQDALASAEAKAQRTCATGALDRTARAGFLKEMKLAQDRFLAATKQFDAPTTTPMLLKDRQAAVLVATEAFTKSVEHAVTELKKVFPQEVETQG